MAELVKHTPAITRPVPELAFNVCGAEPLEYAAVPTLKFALGIVAPGRQEIRSVLLDVQIQISARQRGYDEPSQERLLELFGTPDRWATTLRTLPWLRTTLVVPAFSGETVTDVLVPCSYDFEVSASRYLAALSDGEIPLEFMFSGSVFFSGADGGLQMSRIGWESDAHYRLPLEVWRQTMDRHFPGASWLRLRKECFDRLCAYKAGHAFNSWEAAINALLDARESM
jgi:hypothetical protein